MQKKRKRWKWALLLLVLPVVWGALFTTDCIRAHNNMLPVFAAYENSYLDGGSTVYRGLGYKVIRYVKPVEEGDTVRFVTDRVEVGPPNMKFHNERED